MNKENHNPSPEFNRDREFAVILEDINSKFDILAEGQSGIINRLDRLEVKVDGLEVKVGRLEMKTDVMYKELSGQSIDIREIKNTLKSQDNRLARLELARGAI